MNDDEKTVAEMLDQGDVVLSTDPAEPIGEDQPADAPHNETPTEQLAKLYHGGDSRIIPDNEDG